MSEATSAARRLVRLATEKHPDLVARLMEHTADRESAELLTAQAAERAAGILSRVTPDRASRILAESAPATAARWIAGMRPSRVAGMLARLDEEPRQRLLDALAPELRADLAELARYPADTAGGLMDPRVTTFRPDTPARDAVRRLRTFRNHRMQDVYLVDEAGRLVATVPLVEAVLARSETRLEALGRPPVAVVQATASRIEVLEVLDRHAASSVPVVDFQGTLLGVLRQGELMVTARQAAAASVAAMFGAGRDERALSPPLHAVRRRLPWLLINLMTAFLASAVVALFESTIASVTALAVLLPIVAGQSGNTGAQALAVTMRGLALREIRARHTVRVALKELLAGAVNGTAVAIVTGLAVWAWSGSTGLAGVIAVSMVLSMATASLAGATIPMLLTALRQDPAQSSSIFLTTVTDVAGFASFLGIASALSTYL
jgi:magnesium transporter